MKDKLHILNWMKVIICHPEMKSKIETEWLMKSGDAMPNNILLWPDYDAPVDKCYIVDDLDIKMSILKQAGYFKED